MKTLQARNGVSLRPAHIPRAFQGSAPRWRQESDVFAAGELGWVAEQAHRRVNLELGWPDGPALLYDLHLRDEAFRRLAAHPRLLARACDLIGGPIAIATTALFAGQDIRLPETVLAADALVLVALTSRHPSTPGAIAFGTRLPEDTRADWPFLIALRRAVGAEPPAVAVADDALWPDAASVAG
jgi:hypothetical protein